MILKVELFARVESEEISARDLKTELTSRITEHLKSEYSDLLGEPVTVKYNSLEGRKLKAKVIWLTESEAYNSLK